MAAPGQRRQERILKKEIERVTSANLMTMIRDAFVSKKCSFF